MAVFDNKPSFAVVKLALDGPAWDPCDLPHAPETNENYSRPRNRRFLVDLIK